MPHGIKNWVYKDVAAFLKEKGFVFYEERKGSHEAWVNPSTECVVEINYHAQKSFPPRTLETMIRQSGIPKKEWRQWTQK